MRRIDSGDPDRLAYLGGGGCVSVFGVPFLAVGLFTIFMALTFQMPFKKGTPAGAFDAIAGSVFGLPFLLAGAALVFGRKGVIFDRRAQTIISWSGALGWRRENAQPFARFDKVRIVRETRRVQNNRVDVFYRVYLGLPASPGSSDLLIDGLQSELECRQMGERISAFINMQLVDALSGSEVVREPERLNETLRQRLLRMGERIEVGAPPALMRSSYVADGNRVRVSFPANCFTPSQIPGLLFVGALVFGGSYFFFKVAGGPGLARDPVIKWFAGGISFGVPALFLLSGANGGYFGSTVEVESGKLTVRWRLGGKSVLLDDELEELRIELTQRGLCLAAIADQKLARFGFGLSREELEWIRNVLIKSMETEASH